MNQELAAILYFLVTSVVAGLIGTAGMTLFMYLVTRWGLTNARMVRAIGSIFTGSLDSALLVGSILHLVSGIAFAMAYTIMFNVVGLHGVIAMTGVGVLIGALHGFVLSFVLVISVAENHPLPEFQDAGFSVAAAHLVGHIIYGGLVGLTVALSGFTVTA